MKDSIRRILMFGAVIAGGLIIVLIDIPLFYLMVILIIIIFAILIASGTIPLGRLRQIRRTKSEAKPAEKKVVKEKKGKPAEKTGGTRETFSLMKKGFSTFLGNIGKRKEKPAQPPAQKAALKKTRAPEKPVKSALSEVPQMTTPASTRPDADPLLPLVNEEIDTDLLDSVSLDDDLSLLDAVNPELDAPVMPEGDIEKLDITIDDEEASITLDEDNTDEVKDILDQNVDEIGSTIDRAGGEADLDSISLDSGSGKEPAGTGAEPSPSWMSSPGLDDDEGGEGEQEDAFSFGGEGGSDEDDLLASLQSDIKSIKKNDEDSLLRELKNVKVPAVDLEKELTSVIEMLNKTGG
jgi:hypothetical protein